jgi:hypothetical protein
MGAAHNRQTLTYGTVARLIGMKRAGVMNQMLDYLVCYCKDHGLPPITILVANKGSGKPGKGLTTIEELNQDRERVFNYNWFALPPLTVDDLQASHNAVRSPKPV